jgi:hypothetical protein
VVAAWLVVNCLGFCLGLEVGGRWLLLGWFS